MPRYFDSISDAQTGIRGYKSRNAFAVAQREARQAELNSPDALARAAHLRVATEDHRRRNVVATAEYHLTALREKLTAAQRRAAFVAEAEYRSGIVTAEAVAVRRQLAGLPDLISRAERELAEARGALAAYRERVAEVHAVEPPAIDACSDADPVEEAPKGRGRPRKVTA